MKGTSRKVTIGIIAVFSLVVIVVGVVIALQLGQTQAPEDTSAAGYGAIATRDFYDDVHDLFTNIPCEIFLNSGLAVSLAESKSQPLTGFTWQQVSGRIPGPLIPKDCNYVEEPGKQIRALMHTYGISSYVYESEEEKFALVNGSLIEEVLDSGEVAGTPIDYFFGPSKEDPTVCIGTVFHAQNEFDYVNINYAGYDSCQSLIYKNQVLSEVVGEMIAKQIESVNTANGFTPDSSML